MAEREYDSNVGYEREKTVRGGLLVRTAVIGVIAGVLALSTTYVMSTTEDTAELVPEQRLAMNEPQLTTPDSGYTTLPPQDAALPAAETAAPAQQRAEAPPRPVPRRAAPAERFEPAPPPAEPALTGAPPALPAPADPAQTIPDIVDPVSPSVEG